MKLLPKDIFEAPPFQAFLADIAALGVTPVLENGELFTVIAARSNPRWWLLPLDARKAYISGLEMQQPITVAAKIAKAVARGLARYAPIHLYSRYHLRLSGQVDLNGTFEQSNIKIAYFTGTDGPHRKTSIQIMDQNGKILGYGKLSRAEHIRPYLRNEASILKHIGAMELRSVDVPKVETFRDDEAVTLLITDSMKSSAHTVPLIPGRQHLEFLTELRSRTESFGARVVLDELAVPTRVRSREWAARLKRVEQTLLPHADSIPTCLTHGDFTPWNTFLQGGRLYVFDWEYARQDWPVGFDLVHFLLSTTPSSEQISRIDELISRLSQTQFGCDAKLACRALLLSLACHASFYLGRLLDTGNGVTEWRDGYFRAAMIDRLLDLEASVA